MDKGELICILQHHHVREVKKSNLCKGRGRLVHFHSLRSELIAGRTKTGEQHGLRKKGLFNTVLVNTNNCRSVDSFKAAIFTEFLIIYTEP